MAGAVLWRARLPPRPGVAPLPVGAAGAAGAALVFESVSVVVLSWCSPSVASLKGFACVLFRVPVLDQTRAPRLPASRIPKKAYLGVYLIFAYWPGLAASLVSTVPAFSFSFIYSLSDLSVYGVTRRRARLGLA